MLLTPAYDILFNLVDIQVIPEPLLPVFSVMNLKRSQKQVSGNITATVSDHPPQFLISPNAFADLPSNKSNVFEKD